MLVEQLAAQVARLSLLKPPVQRPVREVFGLCSKVAFPHHIDCAVTGRVYLRDFGSRPTFLRFYQTPPRVEFASSATAESIGPALLRMSCLKPGQKCRTFALSECVRSPQSLLLIALRQLRCSGEFHRASVC
jgi:hypothetical protein